MYLFYSMDSLDDWHKLPSFKLNQNLLQKYGSKLELLSAFYPGNWNNLQYFVFQLVQTQYIFLIEFLEYDWFQGHVEWRSDKFQYLMFTSLRQLFPQHDIFFNFKHPQLVFPDTKHKIEVMLWCMSKTILVWRLSAFIKIGIWVSGCSDCGIFNNKGRATLSRSFYRGCPRRSTETRWTKERSL